MVRKLHSSSMRNRRKLRAKAAVHFWKVMRYVTWRTKLCDLKEYERAEPLYERALELLRSGS